MSPKLCNTHGTELRTELKKHGLGKYFTDDSTTTRKSAEAWLKGDCPVAKIDRVVGVQVRAKCKKNKVGLPFRECDYPILFGYGIDDLTASAEWLIDNHREHLLQEVGLSKAGYKIRINHVRNNGGSEAKALRDQLTPIIKREWSSIEVGFLPKSRKY